jgi:hypothetical protein
MTPRAGPGLANNRQKNCEGPNQDYSQGHPRLTYQRSIMAKNSQPLHSLEHWTREFALGGIQARHPRKPCRACVHWLKHGFLTQVYAAGFHEKSTMYEIRKLACRQTWRGATTRQSNNLSTRRQTQCFLRALFKWRCRQGLAQLHSC